MKVNFKHYLEVILPAEIELDIEADLIPGSSGYFNLATGDCDPPSYDEVELSNEDQIEQAIRQWFSDQCQETLKQWFRFTGDPTFSDLVKERSYNG